MTTINYRTETRKGKLVLDIVDFYGYETFKKRFGAMGVTITQNYDRFTVWFPKEEDAIEFEESVDSALVEA